MILNGNSFTVGCAEKRLIGKEWNDVVWDRHHHQIQFHRLYYPISGEAKLHLYNKKIDLIPGYVYFIPAFSILQSEIEGKMNKFYIHFLAHSPVFSTYKYFSDTYFVKSSEITYALFDCIVKYFNKNTQEAHMNVQGALNLILAPFFSSANTNRMNLIKFEGVLNYIEENYKTNISLDKLASIMNISTMYFSNYFKEVFNISPKQYILNKRLDEAQRLLLQSELSVKEIAYATGFQNESYFSEYFSSKIGTSALKFRNRQLPEKRESIL